MGSNAKPTLVHKRWNSSDTENSLATMQKKSATKKYLENV